MNHRRFLLCAGLTLAMLPVVARAEVSVILDGHGHVRRVVYLTRDAGRAGGVWKQMRPRVPYETLLNPLGDTTGDLSPSIAIHPVTGQPWVVWPRNEGNQKRLVFSTWTGKAWTAPQPIAVPDMMGWDQIEPRLTFDPVGTPYLLFTEAARKGRILFTTVMHGAWTPPLPLTDGSVDSRSPGAAVVGDTLQVTWTTPSGVVSQSLQKTSLLESATNLMDSPIPPGTTTKPDDPRPHGGGTEDPDDQLIFPH